MTATAALPDSFTLLHLAEVDSTNEEAKRRAAAGAGEGLIVWADRQHAGRGRLGRVWQSPPGNLYASILLTPNRPAAKVAQLSFAAALAVGDVLSPLLPNPDALRCKWPNDVLVADRKIAGILLESQAERGAIASLVIGIGVNLVSFPENTETPATSLAACGGTAVSAERLLTSLAARLLHWHEEWRARGFAPLRQAWLARADALGREICVRGVGAETRGRFVDLDATGALVLESAGERKHISAGAIFPAN